MLGKLACNLLSNTAAAGSCYRVWWHNIFVNQIIQFIVDIESSGI